MSDPDRLARPGKIHSPSSGLSSEIPRSDMVSLPSDESEARVLGSISGPQDMVIFFPKKNIFFIYKSY